MPLNQPLGPAGPIGMNFRTDGDWAVANQPYRLHDVVPRLGSSYIAIVDNPVTDPFTDGVNWRTVAKGGSNATSAKSLVHPGGNKISTTAAGTLAITVPTGGHALGSLLVIPVMVGNSGASGTAPVTITGVADNHTSTTNVYTVEASSGVVTVTNQYRLQLCWCILTTALVAGDIITVTFSGSSQTDLAADTAEFTNVVARDVAAVSASPTGTTIAAGSMTPSVSGDLLIVAYSATNPTSVNAGQVQMNILVAAGALTRGFLWTYALLPSNAAVNPSQTIAASQTQTATAMLFR